MRARILALAAAAAAGLAASSAAPDGVFRDATKPSGIRFRIGSDLRRLKLIPTMIGGCAFGDYDGDGRPDLYVTSSIPAWGKPNTKACGRLYRNVGDGRFEDVTERTGIRACGLGMGAFWADLDGDGRLDLYLTNVGPNAVWWNRGDGTFEEGKDTGLEDPLFSVGAAFLDADGDGRVDVVVANYLETTPLWEAAQPQLELRVPEDYVGQPSHLFRNEGGRRFRDVTRESGLDVDPRETKTLGVAVVDYDGDGLPDLFFVNDRVSNRLFRNRGGGRFEETTAEAGAGVLGDHPRAGMGIAVGDPFGSGRPSLFVTNFGGEPDSLYRNVEGTLFEDAGSASGAGDPGQRFVRWGTQFADFDNDGWPDLYAVAGHLAPRLVRVIGPLPQRKGRLRRGRRPRLGAADDPPPQRAGAIRALGRLGRPRTDSDGRARAARSPTWTAMGASTSSSWISTGRRGSSRIGWAAARAGSRSSQRRVRTAARCSGPGSAWRPEGGRRPSGTRCPLPTPRALSCRCISGSAARRRSTRSSSSGPAGRGRSCGISMRGGSIAWRRGSRRRSGRAARRYDRSRSMIPLSDDNTGRRTAPLVNWAIIAVNVLVFVFLQGLGTNERFTLAYAAVPYEILTGKDVAESVPIRDEYGRTQGAIDLQPTPIPVFLTLLTSMFMHGGIAHIAGNMLYLHIFGDNVEDALGHGRYLLFYLLCGVLAGLAHVATAAALGKSELVPSLGASGAISGVLSGYVVLFPRRRVRVLMFYSVMDVPAIVAIGLWFLFQLVSGVGMLGGAQTGVAYGAHIGGFLAGLVLVKLFARPRPAAWA